MCRTLGEVRVGLGGGAKGRQGHDLGSLLHGARGREEESREAMRLCPKGSTQWVHPVDRPNIQGEQDPIVFDSATPAASRSACVMGARRLKGNTLHSHVKTAHPSAALSHHLRSCHKPNNDWLTSQTTLLDGP